MKRLLTGVAMAASLVLVAGTTWAEPAAPYAARIEGKVSFVDPAAETMILGDGTQLTATTPQQLDGIRTGSTVRVLFVEDQGKKEIERIDLLAY
jgi:Protein of unknown function (DUF1344)